MNESSSEPSVKLTTLLEPSVKSPLNIAVSQADEPLPPVLLGGYMLESKGKAIVPVPVSITSGSIEGLHHSISLVAGLTSETPGEVLDTTGIPLGPSMLPSATLGLPEPPKSGEPVPALTSK